MISFKQFITEQTKISFTDDVVYTLWFFESYLKEHEYNNEVIDINVRYEKKINFRSKALKEIEWKFGKISCTFDIAENNLVSLKNGPEFVEHNFFCNNNELETLDHCPEHVGDTFDCHNNKITSLIGIHKKLKLCCEFHCQNNPIEEGGLGLLMINELQLIITDNPAIQIIRKYLGKGKTGIIACQKELIENGYERFAKI